MLNRHDGTNWVDIQTVKRYDGTQWVNCQFVRRWDGSQWVDVWTGKRMAYFHNGDGTSDCSISNGTATINMTVPSNSQGSAGLQSNFDLAVGDEVEISMAFNLGTTGINYRMAVITVGTRNGGHVVNHWDGSVYDSGDDVPVTYSFTSEDEGQLSVYIDSSETMASGVTMKIVISSVKVNGVSITLAES